MKDKWLDTKKWESSHWERAIRRVLIYEDQLIRYKKVAIINDQNLKKEKEKRS